MPFTSTLTGFSWPKDDDRAKDALGTDGWTNLDRQIAGGAIVVRASSVADRDAKFPSPGASTRPRVRIGSQEHRWDGSQWLIWDDKPLPFTPGWFAKNASDGSEYALSIDPNASGDGQLTGWWQRQGHHAHWGITVVRGDDTWQGGAGNFYTWSMPFAPYNSAVHGEWTPDDSGQTCVVRTPANGVQNGFAAWYSSTRVYCIMPTASGSDKSLGTSTYTWAAGATIKLGGITRIGGLL